MKKLLVIILSIHFLGVLWGQTNTSLIAWNDSIVGTSYKTGIPVMATQYVAPGENQLLLITVPDRLCGLPDQQRLCSIQWRVCQDRFSLLRCLQPGGW